MASNISYIVFPGQFNPQTDKWCDYREKILWALYAAGFHNIECTKASSLFLSQCGKEMYALIASLLFPKKPRNVELVEIITVLNRFYEPEVNEILESEKFHKRVQLPSESILDFIVGISELGAKCNFLDLRRQLRDRLVLGVRDDRLRRDMLKTKNLTYEIAAQICLKYQATFPDLYPTNSAVSKQTPSSDVQPKEIGTHTNPDSDNKHSELIDDTQVMCPFLTSNRKIKYESMLHHELIIKDDPDSDNECSELIDDTQVMCTSTPQSSDGVTMHTTEEPAAVVGYGEATPLLVTQLMDTMSKQDREQSATQNKLSTMEQLDTKDKPEAYNDDTPHVHNMQQTDTFLTCNKKMKYESMLHHELILKDDPDSDNECSELIDDTQVTCTNSKQDREQSATQNKLSTMEQLDTKVEPETHNDDTPHVHNMHQTDMFLICNEKINYESMLHHELIIKDDSDSDNECSELIDDTQVMCPSTPQSSDGVTMHTTEEPAAVVGYGEPTPLLVTQLMDTSTSQSSDGAALHTTEEPVAAVGYPSRGAGSSYDQPTPLLVTQLMDTVEEPPVAAPRAAGVRVRGGRARGAAVAGARGAATKRRHHAVDNITIEKAEDLTRYGLMEARMHPKKRRTVVSDYYVYRTATVATEPVAAVTLPPRTQPTGTAASEAADIFSPRPQIESLSNPSSVEFDACGASSQSTSPGPPPSPLRDEEVDVLVINGSENEDCNSSEDEHERRCVIPRILRSYLAVDEDTPEESEAAGLICLEKPVENGGVFEGPTSLFEFEWQAFPPTPISPRERREMFRGSFGPMINPTSSPYDAFVKIWDRLIMERIAHETNAYAQHYAETRLQRGELGPSSLMAKWRDTDADELYVYFALVIAMGMVVKSKIENYWKNDNTIFSTPGFSANMSLNRFQILSRCLHFNNNSSLSPEIDSSEAETFQIQPIVDHLNFKFSTLYGLGQNIALDESLAQWKGWREINQHTRKKAATGGIKTYEVYDSQTGYLWRFELHAGGETHAEQPIIKGAIPNLVLRLLRGLEHRGHTVWMDKYYNSPALARVLKILGYDCVGSLRTNRQFVPEKIADVLKSDTMVGMYGCTSGDVDLMVWRDRNGVAMISTYHGTDVSENKPTLIRDYNIYMGGVDKKDQIIAMYPMERKRTQIWYMNFFRRLLNVSILNAYIIHSHFTRKTQHRDFRVALVTEMLQQHQRRPELLIASVRGVRRFTAETIAHFPSTLPTRPRGDKIRRLCAICKKRTHYFCNACQIALCFTLKSSSSCYIKHHT